MNRWTRNLLIALAIAVLGVTGLSVASGETPSQAANGFSAAAPVVPAVQTEFVPVQPCRVADTRHGGGQLRNNASRNFFVRGTTGFAAQGGKSGGCGIPAGASAVTTNVTVTGLTHSGYLTGYPAGTAEPLTNFISYTPGSTVTANPTFTLSAPSVNPQLTIRTHGSAAQVIIDVTGYYTPTISASVNANGTFLSHTSRVLSVSIDAPTGIYVLTFDRDISPCAVTATADTAYRGWVEVKPSQNQALMVTRQANGKQVAAAFYFTVAC